VLISLGPRTECHKEILSILSGYFEEVTVLANFTPECGTCEQPNVTWVKGDTHRRNDYAKAGLGKYGAFDAVVIPADEDIPVTETNRVHATVADSSNLMRTAAASPLISASGSRLVVELLAPNLLSAILPVDLDTLATPGSSRMHTYAVSAFYRSGSMVPALSDILPFCVLHHALWLDLLGLSEHGPVEHGLPYSTGVVSQECTVRQY
ncbi:hypothetical protein KIPB_005620, partial [Kipferlia bialata]